MQGTMIWFDPDKRHGFIRTEDGERLRVEETGFAPGHMLGDRCAGTVVSFERVSDGDEPLAVGVMVVPTVDQARARRRR